MFTRHVVFLNVLILSGMAGCGGDSNPEPFVPSIVVEWNVVALGAIQAAPAKPTVNSRALFLTHASIYDAWAAYDDVANGTQWGGQLRRPPSERDDAHKREAISYAAYHALVHLYPAHETKTGAFSAQMHKLGLPTDPATLARRDRSSAAGIGNLVAETLLTARRSDGSNEAGNYAEVVSATYPTFYAPANSADPVAANSVGGPTFDPARWQPLRVPTGTRVDPATGFPVVDNGDPSTFSDQKFLTPHWGAVRPFALLSGNELRPPAPARPGSTEPYTDALGNTLTGDLAYRWQVDEVVRLTAELTERQKAIAEYWADGPKSLTPPGHWNSFAADLSFKHRFGIDDDVKLFFALNGALMDSSIACWESKRHYDYIRPVSAVRHLYFGTSLPGWAGPGLGTQLVAGAEWRPFQLLSFITPAFPEYTSGHSTFSAAAAQVLATLTGSEVLFDGHTQLPYDRNGDGLGDFIGEYIVLPGSLTIEPGLPSQAVVLRWGTLKEAADEAGFSRRYGGIHFQDGDLHGRRMGEEIGRRALRLAQDYWRGAR